MSPARDGGGVGAADRGGAPSPVAGGGLATPVTAALGVAAHFVVQGCGDAAAPCGLWLSSAVRMPPFPFCGGPSQCLLGVTGDRAWPLGAVRLPSALTQPALGLVALVKEDSLMSANTTVCLMCQCAGLCTSHSLPSHAGLAGVMLE